MYIVNRMVVCVKMMSKGPKEALTVLIVTRVKKVESGVCGLCTQYRYIQCYFKRVERSLNSFIVTHVTHVKRVKKV